MPRFVTNNASKAHADFLIPIERFLGTGPRLWLVFKALAAVVTTAWEFARGSCLPHVAIPVTRIAAHMNAPTAIFSLVTIIVRRTSSANAAAAPGRLARANCIASLTVASAQASGAGEQCGRPDSTSARIAENSYPRLISRDFNFALPRATGSELFPAGSGASRRLAPGLDLRGSRGPADRGTIRATGPARRAPGQSAMGLARPYFVLDHPPCCHRFSPSLLAYPAPRGCQSGPRRHARRDAVQPACHRLAPADRARRRARIKNVACEASWASCSSPRTWRQTRKTIAPCRSTSAAKAASAPGRGDRRSARATAHR